MLVKNLGANRCPGRVIFDAFLAVATVAILISHVATQNLQPSKLWETEDNFAKIVKIAEDASKLIKSNSQVYSLGQKSAWVVKTLEIFSSLDPSDQKKFHYIPFSENFVEYEHETVGDYTIFFSQHYLSEKEQENYQLIFQDLGLNPIKILTEYKDFGRQTVVVGYSDAGRSITPFINLILQ